MVRKQQAINNSPPQAGIASSKQQLADVPVAVMTPHAEDRAAVAVGASHAKERITQIDNQGKCFAEKRKHSKQLQQRLGFRNASAAPLPSVQV